MKRFTLLGILACALGCLTPVLEARPGYCEDVCNTPNCYNNPKCICQVCDGIEKDAAPTQSRITDFWSPLEDERSCRGTWVVSHCPQSGYQGEVDKRRVMTVAPTPVFFQQLTVYLDYKTNAAVGYSTWYCNGTRSLIGKTSKSYLIYNELACYDPPGTTYPAPGPIADSIVGCYNNDGACSSAYDYCVICEGTCVPYYPCLNDLNSWIINPSTIFMPDEPFPEDPCREARALWRPAQKYAPACSSACKGGAGCYESCTTTDACGLAVYTTCGDAGYKCDAISDQCEYACLEDDYAGECINQNGDWSNCLAEGYFPADPTYPD